MDKAVRQVISKKIEKYVRQQLSAEGITGEDAENIAETVQMAFDDALFNCTNISDGNHETKNTPTPKGEGQGTL